MKRASVARTIAKIAGDLRKVNSSLSKDRTGTFQLDGHRSDQIAILVISLCDRLIPLMIMAAPFEDPSVFNGAYEGFQKGLQLGPRDVEKLRT